MSQLEEKLIETMLKTYSARGKDVQGILDNQLFKSLPLSKKVELLEKYKGDLSKVPGINWSSIGRGALSGALTGLVGVMAENAAAGKFSPKGILLGGLAGAGVGGLYQAINAHLTNKDNKETATDVHNNNIIQALVNRSLMTKKETPNRLLQSLGRVEAGAIKGVHTMTYKAPKIKAPIEEIAPEAVDIDSLPDDEIDKMMLEDIASGAWRPGI